MEKPKIKECFIAYFDLLGYKEFINNNPNKINEFLNVIHSAIEGTKRYLKSINDSPILSLLANVNIQYKIFSDNILLCMETDELNFDINRLLIFLSTVADIQKEFIILYGLFMRGGVTQGQIAISKDFVFGKGLIEVVTMEDSAIYPRIILSQLIVDKLDQMKFNDEELEFVMSLENRAKESNSFSQVELKKIEDILNRYEQYCFYQRWKYSILWMSPDGKTSVSYLYKFDYESMFSKNRFDSIMKAVEQKSPYDYNKIKDAMGFDFSKILEEHKKVLSDKIKEYGKFDSSIKDNAIREHILKKYLWSWVYHNSICTRYGFNNFIIQLTFAPESLGFYLTAEIFDKPAGN